MLKQPIDTTSRLSWRRLVLALAVAAGSDLVSLFVQLAPPLDWAVDLATALTLFAILGWRWLLLPALIAEAIPGLATLPTWIVVVLAIAIWGKVRPVSR
jgi:hypothetical protein